MFKTVLLGFTFAVAFTTIGWRGHGKTELLGPTPSLSRIVPADMDFDELLSSDCYRCKRCGFLWLRHQLVGTPLLEGGRRGHPEGCEPGSCTLHDRCRRGAYSSSADPDRLVTAFDAIRTASPGELRDLLNRYPRRVRVNQSRRSLQFLGCDDQVVASYGVESIRGLEALLQ